MEVLLEIWSNSDREDKLSSLRNDPVPIDLKDVPEPLILSVSNKADIGRTPRANVSLSFLISYRLPNLLKCATCAKVHVDLS